MRFRSGDLGLTGNENGVHGTPRFKDGDGKGESAGGDGSETKPVECVNGLSVGGRGVLFKHVCKSVFVSSVIVFVGIERGEIVEGFRWDY